AWVRRPPLGETIVAGARIDNVDALPRASAILCDLSPRPLLRIAGHRFPAAYRAQLERYRYGMGAFKVDWALSTPIRWKDPRVRDAGTVHVGGTLEEIAFSERETFEGRIAERPFVLLAQPTLVDGSPAPRRAH